jgi:hypothetical protein
MAYITQVLLPKRDKFGRPFPRQHHVAFHRRMIRRFGGWTRKGKAEGAWLGLSGEVLTDEHWVYEIGHERRNIGFWREEKERLKADFEQEEIWIVQYEGRRI